MEIDDPVLAIAFDEAVALRLTFEDARAHREAAAIARSSGHGIPEGFRYERLVDVMEAVN